MSLGLESFGREVRREERAGRRGVAGGSSATMPEFRTVETVENPSLTRPPGGEEEESKGRRELVIRQHLSFGRAAMVDMALFHNRLTC